jgi:hypothetical protein
LDISTADIISHMKRYFLFVLIAASGAALNARAQIGGLVNQVENTRTRNELNESAGQVGASNAVPQLYEGESSDVGPQSVLQSRPRRTLFQAEADEQFFYTDNVLLTETRKQGTGVLLSTAQFALAPTPFAVGDGALSAQLGYRAQWFDFGLDGGKINDPQLELHDLDFNAQTVFSDLLWTRGGWTFGGGLDATRLFTTGDYISFYEELVPSWVARRVFSVNDRIAFAASYEGDYRATHIHPQFLEFATSDAGDRTDHNLLLTYTQVLCKHVVFEPYYNLKYTHFTDYPLGPRNDYLNSFGAGLYLLVCPNFSVRTFVNYDILKSGNSSVPQYHQLDLGGGVNVTFRF